MKPVKLINLLLSLLLTVTMLTSTAQSALLDVGPTVPQLNPSTEGTFGLGNAPLGHGFPLWYRDSNRVPLQLCTDRASGMCLTAEPTPGASLSFPNNMGDELFWWVGDALIDFPAQGALTSPGSAILVQAIEAAYSTGSPVSGAQVSFARIRIRIDTPYVGTYLVTTPFKQFTFVVDAASLAGGINFTEDIGIAEGGVFTGALSGTVGPFLYCTTAPIVVGGGSYVGDPNLPCTVLGSTFNPPSLSQPANYFKVQGPSSFDIQTTQFNVMGKLYTDPISTPLTVDRATYALDASGMQINTFATTQAFSNQTGAGAFPLNFALTGAASALEFSGTDITTKSMTTNSPDDGKFFAASGIFTAPATTPTSITVTNTADTPDTVKTVSLVDEVKITVASYNPTTSTLLVAASSSDKIAASVLQVFIPSEPVLPLGTIAGGQLSVTFPVALGAKTYNIPPETVKVTSSLGATTTTQVSVISLPAAPVAAAKPAWLSTPSNANANGTVYIISDASPTLGAIYNFEYSTNGGTSWSPATVANPSAVNPTITLPAPGTYLFRVYVTATGYLPSDYTTGTGPCVYSAIAATPSYLSVPLTVSSAGNAYLIAGASSTTGARYNFQYRIVGSGTWIDGALDQALPNVTITLPSPGIYEFQSWVTAIGYTASPARVGNNTCTVSSVTIAPPWFSVPATTTNGNIYVIAGLSPTPGASYIFEYSTTGIGGPWTAIGVVGIRNQTLTLPPATGTTTYTLRVTAVDPTLPTPVYTPSTSTAGNNTVIW